jgi:hypothetical protein
MADKNSTFSFKMSVEQLTEFLKKIKDLTTIDNRIIMSVDSNNVLLFSFVGETFKNIHAFKNYIYETEKIFTLKEEIKENIFLIVKDGKKFYKKLENLIDYDKEIKGKISVNDENFVNLITFDNDKLPIKIIGSDPIAIGKDISIDDINLLMDTDNSLFNFNLPKLDFQKIKKMGMIENEPNSVLYINIDNNKLTIGETLWQINICDVESENNTMAFPKKYFNTINPTDSILIYVFENFLLCKYDDYNLMILMETSI